MRATVKQIEYTGKGAVMLAEYFETIRQQPEPASTLQPWKVHWHWFPDCIVEWSWDGSTNFFSRGATILQGQEYYDGLLICMKHQEYAVAIYSPWLSDEVLPTVMTISDPPQPWVEGVIHRYLSQLARTINVPPPW